jgi:hypothetical protein
MLAAAGWMLSVPLEFSRPLPKSLLTVIKMFLSINLQLPILCNLMIVLVG